jgi:catechol 2,3-dioxygenase-like lactoylglutathione lyase family enzyme
MTDVFSRPEAKFAPGAGLYRNDLFQIAYVTNDIERALKMFGERYGVKEWRRMAGPLAAGGRIRVEFGWAGGVLFEVTQADGPGSELYRLPLPENEFAIRFHHLGFIVPTEAAWQALLEEIATTGVKVCNETNVPGFLQARIVEAPELGHHIEYIYPQGGGIAFFQGVPSN